MRSSKLAWTLIVAIAVSHPLQMDWKRSRLSPKGKNSNQRGAGWAWRETLKTVTSPDRVVVIRPDKCLCGSDISAQPFRVLAKCLEFEIPEPKLEVTEFQTVEDVCPGCGKVHQSEFPQGINAPAQYGVKAKAFVCLLSNEAKLSFEKTQTIFNDLFGYNINQSTIITANASCYENLAQTESHCYWVTLWRS